MTQPLALDTTTAARIANGCVLTIGNFDGVHRGHLALIEPVVAEAAERDLPAAAMTFEPHPVALFRGVPDDRFRLTTTERRATLLRRHGIDVVITVPFSREFASIEPAAFVHEALIEQCRACHIHVGYDFNFGKGRAGTTDVLTALAAEAGVPVTVHEAVRIDDEPVSSTRVRRALESGDLALLERLLGRRYRIAGTTAHGAGRGKGMGVPTLNLYPTGVLLPPRGVYGTRVHAGGGTFDSISNLGVRPSFDDGDRVSFETMVLDGDPGLEHGAAIEVELLGFIRPEQSFDGPDALRAQIGRDVEQARRQHAACPAAD